MKLVGIMPVRNEGWVLGLSARAALMWCDELLILLHASDLETERVASEITNGFPGRAFVAFDADPKWREMEQRQSLLGAARGRGATHIALVDADEVLTGNLLPTIREYIGNLNPGYVLRLPGYNLRGSIDRYHANGIWGNRDFSLAFKDDPRANWHGDEFHHREPFGVQNLPYMPVAQGQGGIMHLWGASERRLIAKHKLYKILEVLRWPHKPISEIDRMYNLAIRESASNGSAFACHWKFSDVPYSWWAPYAGLMRYLHVDAEPWQEKEVERLLAEHGSERFAGLDLFESVSVG